MKTKELFKGKKAVIALILIAILAVTMVACGSNGDNSGGGFSKNTTELILGQLNSIENVAEFTMFKVQTTPKITASLDGGLFYENQNSGETYVDIIFDIKNLKAENVSSEDFLVASAEGSDGTQYAPSLYAIETNNGTYVSAYENIAPLSTARFHCGISVPETETSLKINIAVGEEKYFYNYSVGAKVDQAVTIAKGEKIEAEDFAEFVFKGIEYTDDLLPSNTNNAYSHYEVDDKDNTYLVVKYYLKNLQGSAKQADTFVGIKAVYMDKYTYTGFVVVEDKDGRGFSSYDSIKPLSTGKCYCLIEVPKSVAENEVTLEISFDSKDYTFVG